MLDFGSFIQMIIANPLLIVILALTLGATAVNGATDATNAISPVVGSRAMKPLPAIIMASCCDFLGLCIITVVSTAVAQTMFNMVDFGGDPEIALMAVAAAMIAIIVWGVVAWFFGIPTSQSHSLVAGLTGAAIAVHSGLDGVNGWEWLKVIYGLVISTCLGFGAGWCFTKAIEKIFASFDRRKMAKTWRGLTIASGASMALMHGAQDGQKFLSISMLGIMLCMGSMDTSNMQFPLWLIALTAAALAAGILVGGMRIIKTVGLDMVKMEPHQAFSASLASVSCVALATFTGIPVSTTHTATTAVMGVGAARRVKSVKWGVAGRMVLTWVLTFPGCGLIGFIFTKLFLLF